SGGRVLCTCSAGVHRNGRYASMVARVAARRDVATSTIVQRFARRRPRADVTRGPALARARGDVDTVEAPQVLTNRHAAGGVREGRIALADAHAQTQTEHEPM